MLPTGRNIHALDPYRMPSIAAMDRGAKAAEAILQVGRAAWRLLCSWAGRAVQGVASLPFW